MTPTPARKQARIRAACVLFLSILLSISSLSLKKSVSFQELPQKAFYFCAASALTSVSKLAEFSWSLSFVLPGSQTFGKECLLFSCLCRSYVKPFLRQIFKETPSPFLSWNRNKESLSQIPIFSDEEKKLVRFLENHWLAKSNGFFSFAISWIYPCFGISVQTHPETTSCYSRNPSGKSSQTYKNRVESWKKTLPHPENFPLVLTRPCNVGEYLPCYQEITDSKMIPLAIGSQVKRDSKSVMDVTALFPKEVQDQKEWLHIWKNYQEELLEACREYHVNPEDILCVQRVEEEAIGGLRLLPLTSQSESMNLKHQFLLKWIGGFGLSANRVELDRCSEAETESLSASPSFSVSLEPKETLLRYLNSFEKIWKSTHPQKTLLIKSTLELLKGLMTAISIDKWKETFRSQTKLQLVENSFLKIEELLSFLAHEEAKLAFFEVAFHIEEIHAHLSSLLEIFSPYQSEDFPSIYQELLQAVPKNLQTYTSCSLHSAGMTSIAGIFKAMERFLGRAPRVLYGENTYFECISSASQLSKEPSMLVSSEKDCQEIDLILAQFNPVLRRNDSSVTEYRVEKIADTLHEVLKAKKGTPLTLALDCTLDFIDSPRVGALLREFEEEITAGYLNVIGYRSGLKFDLFGIDNYCGAPFFMIHNQNPQWKAFNFLLSDPVLATDRLSLNWFCLAYKYTASELELYRKQIFDNTRLLLDKAPPRMLYDKSVSYQMTPFAKDATASFIEFRIFGPFHQIRAAALVTGCLHSCSMRGGQPIFTRPSLGFYHPNFGILFDKEYSSIRLTAGLDPDQIDLLADCFEMVDALNGSSWQIFQQILQKNFHK